MIVFPPKRSGITLIELAISLLVIAVIMSFTLHYIGKYRSIANILTMRSKEAAIAEQLELFYKKNGRYPCPARGDLLTSDTNYGTEASNCLTACPGTGMTCTSAAAIGTLPFQTLGLKEDSAYDVWDRRMTFAVSRNFTQLMCSSPGQITINDGQGNAITAPSQTGGAVFAVLSHGADGKGAWQRNGVRTPCGTVGTDILNCNQTSTSPSVFVDAPINDAALGTPFYDDIIAWLPNRLLATCPAGVQGCSAWFDASDVCSVTFDTSNAISQWNDKSTNANDLSQTTPNYMPLYVQATSNPNGLPIVRFDGFSTFLSTTVSFSRSNPQTVIAVSRVNDTNVNQTVYACSTASDCYEMLVAPPSSPQMSIYSGATLTDNEITGSNPGSFLISRAIFNGISGSSIAVNHGIGSVSGTVGPITGNGLTLGRNGNSLSGYLNGDVAEVVVYNRVLTPLEYGAIESYLAKKWGVQLFPY